jgi:hypothetical protein
MSSSLENVGGQTSVPSNRVDRTMPTVQGHKGREEGRDQIEINDKVTRTIRRSVDR